MATDDPKHAIDRRTLLLGGAASLLGAAGCRGRPAEGAAQKRSPRPDLYACEGCEGALERDPARLSAAAAIAGPGEPGERLVLEGTVYGASGSRPAAGIVVYAYHTDAAGLYSRGPPGTEASRRHGLLRGWVRTGRDGRYRFDTIKPAPYPGERYPAHIHLTVLEPGRRPYWIDDVVFAGEFGVGPEYRAARENRGGDGIVALARGDGRLLAVRDIVLEPHPG
jgi:protocatechuate 3,4-dioxygenase beta subunit